MCKPGLAIVLSGSLHLSCSVLRHLSNPLVTKSKILHPTLLFSDSAFFSNHITNNHKSIATSSSTVWRHGLSKG